MDVKSMRMFLALAEELHYGRAAARLFISQPPLTKAIQQLEERLGVTLFDRNKRSVKLTVAGTALVQEARRLLAQTELSIRTVQRAERGDAGRLRIGFVAAVLFMDIREVVLGLERDLPGLESVWEEMGSWEQLQALEQNRIDIGFAQVSQGVGDMRSIPVGRVGLVIALDEGHRLARSRRVKLQELAEDAFVAIPRHSGPSFHDLTIAACMEAGFSPRIMHYAKHLVSVVSLVAMGRGVSLVPRSFARAGVPGVVFKDIDGLVVEAEYSAVWNPANTLPLLPHVLSLLGGKR
ncbi:LysR substrate-binding domain-containing protein [Achromobacter xylosoxidans]|uniref:LysR substrate-binding domain-containing protein n=1 Tax=Alcaligenes xylosoxydans xylosoxydans TaxID=85698 RepID=UPI001F0F1963|nr:LysR substrate-binding domain-containing protein [Achromobacter xylosoxidans]MCH4591946.1 LysR substrate-binding domain-containing protein [Achromobacter xylosoxidans]